MKIKIYIDGPENATFMSFCALQHEVVSTWPVVVLKLTRSLLFSAGALPAQPTEE